MEESKRLYAIWDFSAKRFHALFDDINDVTAARHFHLKTKDLVFPSEFKLVCFGEFIPTSGQINLCTPYDVPVFIPSHLQASVNNLSGGLNALHDYIKPVGDTPNGK